ncbi:hypothetical protein VHEMI03616 [[Torrubiella] hemipterigena]|uniref:N-acetyltransferase domain-containing protein n=1 Tax=[Torrubiella] hemipterigena TaxID=1531966 RepID=A0A0A1TE02_9HYPO|nr:hypothetical protein VHEMI03616 [[Torrubiella] hemipterigena]
MEFESPLQIDHLNARIESTTYPIILRTVQEEDAAIYAELLFGKRNNPEATSDTVDVAKGLEIVKGHRTKMATPTVVGADGRVVSGPPKVNMVVVLKGDNGKDEEVIGLGGYGAIKDWVRDGVNVRAGDAGVMLDVAYRGKGYAVEAMKLAIDWAFLPVSQGGPQLDLVTITTSTTNAAMIKLTEEHLGLKGKGVTRPGEFSPSEEYWEMNKAQWEEAKST